VVEGQRVSPSHLSGSGSEPSTPVESVDALVAFLREGAKPAERWRVGTEHEKIGLRLGDHQVVPFEGDRGIGALLTRVAELDDWNPVQEGSHTIALAKAGASITLEPGGQLELSGAPLRTIHETCDEFHTHLALMKEASDPLGLVWLGLGINPIYGVDRIPVMPKERYRIMRRYLPTRGALALEMMFATATVQANFDYADEADMVEKVRMATAVSSIVSAVFANSGLSEGKPNGYASKRLHIWQHTDPDRCGLLPMVFEPDFGFRRYVEWAVDVPMFFVMRRGEYHATPGLSFRRFVEEGFGEARATLEDFDRHLTTLFPDVRVKRIIEVRGADAVPPGLTRPGPWWRTRPSRCGTRPGPMWPAAGSRPSTGASRCWSWRASWRRSPETDCGGSATPVVGLPTSRPFSIRSSSSWSWRARPGRWWSTAGKASGRARWIA
jgi:glutamate--cysteine ligase